MAAGCRPRANLRGSVTVGLHCILLSANIMSQPGLMCQRCKKMGETRDSERRASASGRSQRLRPVSPQYAPRLQSGRLNPPMPQTAHTWLAMDTHMMQRLYNNHRCVRLVPAIIQKARRSSVNWLAQKPLPPGATLLRSGGKLPQVSRFTISHTAQMARPVPRLAT